MNLRKNEINIIKILLSSSQYISSYEIATATGINRRLVRDEMAHVKTILKSYGYELISKPSNGYIIRERSSESLNRLSKIIEDAERQREYLFPTLPWERKNYIMKRLIDENDYMKIDTLADELLISRSTISNDIKDAKKNLAKYQLRLNHKPNYGICIVGEEVNKRKPICDFMFSNLTESEMHYDFLNNFISQKESMEYGIIQILKEEQIKISDIALCDFLLSLSVSLSRIVMNFHLTSIPDTSIIKNRIEMNVAKKIADYIEEKSGIHFSQMEIEHIAILLVCKRSTKGIIPDNDEKKLKIVDEILNKIYNTTLIRFDNDSIFLNTFSCYIDTYFLCAHFHEKIRNPLYNTIKTAYPLAYELAEITLSVLKEYKETSSSASALALFAMIFNFALNNKTNSKLKVLLISGMGGGSSLVNRQILLNRFENQIEIKKHIQYYEIIDEDISQYDFIISTIPIHKDLSIPYINISQIINDDDLDKIQNYISYLFHTFKPEYYFHPKLYKDHIKTKTMKTVINEFYKLLKQQYPNINESFKNNLIVKNKSTIITFENNIALIKLSKPLNNRNILPTLILENSILLNKTEIKIIVLFSCQDNDNYIYNSLVNIFNKMKNDDINHFIDQSSYIDFLKLLNHYI